MESERRRGLFAATVKQNPLNEPKERSNRREREFLRYGEVVSVLPGWQNTDTAKSSGDISLTAFAQLVTLRLNAKRALICLYDRSYHYILAEATRTLSLQQDDVHDVGDGLFFGTAVIPLGNGLNPQALYPEDGRAVVFPDLLMHERFSVHPLVTGAPYLRSFAGVPLHSPSGFPIGTLSVFDDKPRPEGLSHSQVTIMQDVAASVMSHLELARTKAVYQRGIKMVMGLSRFMEGKLPKNDTTTRGNHTSVSSKRKRTSEIERGSSEKVTTFDVVTHADLVDRSGGNTRDRHRRSLNSPKFNNNVSAGLPRENPTTGGLAQSQMKVDRKDDIVLESHTITTDLQEDIVSKDVAQAFERGAGIVREAMDMAGVLFLHASAGALGNIQPGRHHSPDGSEAGASTTAGSDDALSLDEDTIKRNTTLKQVCRPLAAAYQPREGEAARISHLSISERFLKSLMQRFPYGRIWNFSDDELLSSDEYSDSSMTADVATADSTSHHTGGKRKRLWTDHERILELFPGVRSFGIMPMWDFRSKRFFAGAIIWSYNSSRIFSMSDEISYLGAFCDVIMAEVGRLDVQADMQAKTTFISSISHELRSPLHGILGGVECLQELLDPASAAQMLQMIDTCGRSLLDIINNLLDHAQVSSETGTREHRNKRRKHRNDYRLSAPESVNDLAILTEEVLDSALWSSPEPAPTSNPVKGQSTAIPVSSEPLKVALEVDPTNLPSGEWNFHVNAGAWRRILQNLATNAIKYTDRGGYFKVTLSVSATSDKGLPSYVVELTCSDSGRGMSKEYLELGLWQEFQQEETNVQGTGLGLSLVKGLLGDMGGRIAVQSTKGVGTTIKLSLPLTPGLPSTPHSLETPEMSRLKGLTFGFLGFDAGSEDSRTAQAIDVFRCSIVKACQVIGLRESSSDSSNPDIYFVSEREATSTMEIEDQDLPQEHYRNKPCIILCSCVSSSRAFASNPSPWLTRATIVAQPLGPRKLGRALLSCVSKGLAVGPGGDISTPPISRRSSDFRIAPGSQNASNLPPVLKPLETLERGRVLLVDDNPVNLSLLQKSMQKLGRPQISAVNGLEAVEAYQNSMAKPSRETKEHVSGTDGRAKSPPVTIIFMDITMPIMDGLESTRRIRAYERALKLRPAKIAALTALASPQARQEAFGSGIDLFLTKPVRFKEIQGILEEWDRKYSD